MTDFHIHKLHRTGKKVPATQELICIECEERSMHLDTDELDEVRSRTEEFIKAIKNLIAEYEAGK